ncbi:hypothetical protein B6J31_02425, partial [Klebsiella pneumoniae]
TVCVVGKMRDLNLQLSKSSIYSTKPVWCCFHHRKGRFRLIAMAFRGLFLHAVAVTFSRSGVRLAAL